jgi:membrane protease YdiL (CAAX protease family)
VIIGAGFGEEVVYRGYLFERLGRLLGPGAAVKAGIVAFTSAIFAAGHYQGQGIAGVEQAAITGLVFGSIFAVTREIWSVMVAHAVFDLVAVAIIYFDAESAVAHFFFA